MAIQIQLRQGTTTEHSTFTGAVGEVTVDTTKDTLVVHDGVTVGGHPVAARANADETISLLKKDGTSAGEINASGLFNNTLTSTNTNQALTAAQGKLLKDTVDSLSTSVALSFGKNQTMQDVTSSRAVNTTYTNSTGKPIIVNIAWNYSSGSTNYANFLVNGTSVATGVNQSGDGVSVVVPNGCTYSFSSEGWVFSKWVEYR